MVPNSVLADLRRDAVEQLVEARHRATVIEVVEPDALDRIRSTLARGESAVAPEPQLHVLARTIEQVQALARAAADAGVADAQLARDAERLAQAATAADQRELAQLLTTADRGLREGNDAATRARMRGELAEIAGLSAPIVAEPLPPSAPVPPPKPAPVGGTGLEDDIEMREIFVEEAREVVSDAQAAVERLPDLFRNHLRSVLLRVEDFPDADVSTIEDVQKPDATAPHTFRVKRLCQVSVSGPDVNMRPAKDASQSLGAVQLGLQAKEFLSLFQR
jgi:hypothetical protein